MHLNIAGYTVSEKPIYNGPFTLVFHAVKNNDQNSVVIKILKNEHPSPTEIFRFKNECLITQSINDPCIVHVNEILPYHDSNALVLENITGPTFSEILLSKGKFDISSFLKMAISLANCLDVIHKNHIIHKDINPTNIIWDEKNQCVKIVDFGISVTLSKEKTTENTLNKLEGTFAYLSPEQTGRMNRGVDYRSDYYSLGMVLYHVITGKPAFDYNDVLDYIHAHLAVNPVPPHKVNPDIPVMISEIIMKLVEKTAEKRYQSHHGLLYDIKKCQQQWESYHRIDNFQLGEKESYSQFKIPEKLYGREEQIEILLNKYQAMMEGTTQVVFVSGYSGIGKTSLINEIQKTIVKTHGYYISGKFDQFEHNIPYAAFIQAFNNLFSQILAEPKDKIDEFKKMVIEKLGDNANVLTEILPHLKDILGTTKPIMPLSPIESQNRLNYAFQQLIFLLARKEHPLTLFLDDLQWADLASLKIIETLLTYKNMKYLYVICAYRSNEIDESHPLKALHRNLNENDIVFGNIELLPLSTNNIELLLSDLLHQDKTELRDLARLCHEKTTGNPFFLTQLLHSLHDDETIIFDFVTNNWSWSLNNIKSKSMIDNIADLMSKKIHQLPSDAQTILQVASCIGNQFTSKFIALLCNMSEVKVIESLQIALENELIFTTTKEDGVFYQFSHDRIEKAIYSLLSDEQKAHYHLSIARILCPDGKIKDDNKSIFEIANQYNKVIRQGYMNLIEFNELKKIIEINLSAAKSAKTAGAFEHALKYVDNALKCIKDISWKSDYELLFSLYYIGIDAAYLIGNFKVMEDYITIALPQSLTIFDKLKIIKIKILSYVARSNHSEAIDLVIEMLGELGLKIPRNPSNLYILYVLLKIKFMMIGRSIKSLENLPAMTDPEKIEIIKLLTSMLPSAYSVQPNLIPVLIGTDILLSLKYGNTKEAAIAYTSYGIILCGIFYNMKDGYEFGDLGLTVLDKLGISDERAKIIYLNYGFIKYWIDHILTIYPKLIENYHYGIEKGEIEFACYNIMSYAIYGAITGIQMNEYFTTLETYEPAIAQLGQNNAINYITQHHQAALNLVEKKLHPEVLVGKVFNENKMYPKYIKDNDKTSLFFLGLNKLMLLFYFDRCKEHRHEVYQYINLCDTNKDGVLAGFVNAIFHFYKVLALAELYLNSSFFEKIKIKRSIRISLKLMALWSKYNHLSFEGKYTLLKAVFADISKKNRNSILALYEKSILLMKKSKILNEAAIANEKLGRFYLSEKNEKLAKVYLSDARYYYTLWGAHAKVAHFNLNYEKILFSDEHSNTYQSSSVHSAVTIHSTELSSNALDIHAIQRTSQVIASTIEMHKLLQNLLLIITEYAGAENCCLLLKKGNDYFIEAERYSDNREDSLLQSKKPTDDILPMMIINYVIHKKESLVFDDVSNTTNHYATDPYVVKNKLKSVLCIPLINQNNLTGILYLENNLTAHAFTQDRVGSLILLSSQIAIAIDNANLYTDIKISNINLAALNKAYERFVPHNFLKLLNKNSIIDVKLGNQKQRNMTVLFTDIRQFTTIYEKLTPEENFQFINTFLSYMEPVISRFHGFIDKYIGDAIMALFPTNEDDALQCAIAMIHALKQYNLENMNKNKKEIKIGIGLNSGRLMLGTVGNKNRMEVTVISDVVNIASRVESQTKVYNKEILITENFYKNLKNPDKYFIERVDTVVMKGKTLPITLYSVDASKYSF